MDEELVIVPSPTGKDSCILIYGDDPDRIEWICPRFGACAAGACASGCTAGPYKVWIKQSDMTRYLALKLVS